MSYCRSYKLGSAVQCAVQCSAVVVQWVDSSEPRQVNNRKWQKVVAVARAHCTQTSRALSWTQPLFYCYYFFFSPKKKSLRICTGPSDSFIDQTKCAPTVGPVGPVPMIFLRYRWGGVIGFVFFGCLICNWQLQRPLLPSSSVRVIVLIDSKK